MDRAAPPPGTADEPDRDAASSPVGGRPLPVFDGHNDTLLRLHLAGGDVRPFLDGRPSGHLDLERARRGGMAGGFFAVFVPPPDEDLDALVGDEAPRPPARRPRASRDHVPYARSISHAFAFDTASSVVDLAERLVAASEGGLQWVRSPADLAPAAVRLASAHRGGRAMESLGTPEFPVLFVLHFEGAEPVAADLSDLEHWVGRGLRSLGLVWSRANAFAHGVPFRFPSTPDHFDGLTAAGFELVRACDDLGVLLDLAHLNERGFWDVQRTSRRPLVVTHTGALRVSPSSRNLTDDQVRAVGDSDGVVGVTFHCGDLRPDGRLDRHTPLEVVATHLEALAELSGPRHVAIGSDFDGALMPNGLADAGRLPDLLGLLRRRGWTEEDLVAVAHGNWMRALGAAWT